MPTAWSRESRIFVEQAEGELSYKELHSGQKGISKRFFVGGLKDATVRIYPESHVTPESINVCLNARYPWKEGKIAVARGDEKFGYCFEVKNVTGDRRIVVVRFVRKLYVCFYEGFSSNYAAGVPVSLRLIQL